MEEIFWTLVILFLLWGAGKVLFAWQRRQRLLGLEMDDVDQMTGAEFEAYVAEILRAQGWKIQNIQHSSDFGGDLIGTYQDQDRAIQCKRIQGTAGVEAVQDALSARAYYETEKAMVITTSPRFSQPARKLAQKTDVELVGRSKLSKLRDQAQHEPHRPT